MWKTEDERFDSNLTAILKDYPGISMSVGPVLTAFEAQPYTSQGVVVWVWPNNEPRLARMFSGDDIITEIVTHLETFKNNNVV